MLYKYKLYIYVHIYISSIYCISCISILYIHIYTLYIYYFIYIYITAPNSHISGLSYDSLTARLARRVFWRHLSWFPGSTGPTGS